NWHYNTRFQFTIIFYFFHFILLGAVSAAAAIFMSNDAFWRIIVIAGENLIRGVQELFARIIANFFQKI
ncbi:hypothetical protein AIZ15_24935, partial [Salmonella enterica subsp. enterica serovar Typhimurium]|uniref:hypothetical protein n=1 Tax=Salmonella enterica TaxID=28901 RepID=UPI0007961BA3